MRPWGNTSDRLELRFELPDGPRRRDSTFGIGAGVLGGDFERDVPRCLETHLDELVVGSDSGGDTVCVCLKVKI